MILVLGGTSESLKICNFLNEQSYEFVVTMAIENGETNAFQFGPHMMQIPMNKEEMMHFLEKQRITLVIDAAYPFTTEVSKNAIDLCKKMYIPYVRFEEKTTSKQEENVYIVNSIQKACELAMSLGNRIFVSTASRNLQEYIEKLKDKHIIVSVLPVAEVIEYCEQQGLFAEQIVAMKGPFSKNLNKELFTLTEAEVVIAKEPGKQEQLLEKVEACKELHIPCIIVQQLPAQHPEKVTTIKELAVYLNEIA